MIEKHIVFIAFISFTAFMFGGIAYSAGSVLGTSGELFTNWDALKVIVQLSIWLILAYGAGYETMYNKAKQ